MISHDMIWYGMICASLSIYMAAAHLFLFPTFFPAGTTARNLGGIDNIVNID